eukprot:Clim_evm2s165 gene=Clim_evmTU2s165
MTMTKTPHRDLGLRHAPSKEEDVVVRALGSLFKGEMHAHLNGSVNISALRDIAKRYGRDEYLQYLPDDPWYPSTLSIGDIGDMNTTFDMFKAIHGIICCPDSAAEATNHALDWAAHDNVVHAEFRTTLRHFKGKDGRNDSHRGRSEHMDAVCAAVMSRTEQLNIHRYSNWRPLFIDNRLVFSVDRGLPLSDAQANLPVIMDAKRKYGDLLVGLDFSGNPYKGRVRDFTDFMLTAREKVGVNLVVHGAEVYIEDSFDFKREVQELFSLGPVRWGHGTFLDEDTIHDLFNINCALEVCMTSNLRTGTCKSYEDSHFGKIYPDITTTEVMLCTDDPGLFGTTLTHEYYMAYKHFDLNMFDLMQINRNNFMGASAWGDWQRKVDFDKEGLRWYRSWRHWFPINYFWLEGENKDKKKMAAGREAMTAWIQSLSDGKGTVSQLIDRDTHDDEANQDMFDALREAEALRERELAKSGKAGAKSGTNAAGDAHDGSSAAVDGATPTGEGGIKEDSSSSHFARLRQLASKTPGRTSEEATPLPETPVEKTFEELIGQDDDVTPASTADVAGGGAEVKAEAEGEAEAGEETKNGTAEPSDIPVGEVDEPVTRSKKRKTRSG